MQLHVLKSGSSGNGYILKSSLGEILLLECGVRMSEVKKALNFDLSGIQGAILSHSHQDQSKYTKDYLNCGICVFTSQDTINETGIKGHHNYIPVTEKQKIKIGSFWVIPFTLKHDVTCFGYLISHEEMGLCCFATDTYYIPYSFPGLNQIIVEANYDEEILEGNVFRGSVPEVVKNRVLRSHMELSTFKHFLSITDISNVQNIVMIHLSEGNSDAGRFVSEIVSATGKTTHVAIPGMNINLSKTPF